MEVCFPLVSTFSENDIRLLWTPVSSLSNADLAKVTACCSDCRQLSGWVFRAERRTSKFSAGGTYIILSFRRYVITSAGAGECLCVEVRMASKINQDPLRASRKRENAAKVYGPFTHQAGVRRIPNAHPNLDLSPMRIQQTRGTISLRCPLGLSGSPPGVR
jgi:hypothetical protein